MHANYELLIRLAEERGHQASTRAAHHRLANAAARQYWSRVAAQLLRLMRLRRRAPSRGAHSLRPSRKAAC